MQRNNTLEEFFAAFGDKVNRVQTVSASVRTDFVPSSRAGAGHKLPLAAPMGGLELPPRICSESGVRVLRPYLVEPGQARYLN